MQLLLFSQQISLAAAIKRHGANKKILRTQTRGIFLKCSEMFPIGGRRYLTDAAELPIEIGKIWQTDFVGNNVHR